MNPITYLIKNFIVLDCGALFLPVMLDASLKLNEDTMAIFLQ